MTPASLIQELNKWTPGTIRAPAIRNEHLQLSKKNQTKSRNPHCKLLLDASGVQQKEAGGENIMKLDQENFRHFHPDSH